MPTLAGGLSAGRERNRSSFMTAVQGTQLSVLSLETPSPRQSEIATLAQPLARRTCHVVPLALLGSDSHLTDQRHHRVPVLGRQPQNFVLSARKGASRLPHTQPWPRRRPARRRRRRTNRRERDRRAQSVAAVDHPPADEWRAFGDSRWPRRTRRVNGPCYGYRRADSDPGALPPARACFAASRPCSRYSSR